MNLNIKNISVLMRVANLPTVWTNLLAGWIFGLSLMVADAHVGWAFLASAFNLKLGLMLLGASCLYAAGMVMNDIFDLDWDRAHRPERPLASGQISIKSARVLAGLLVLVGMGFLVLGAAPIARGVVAGLGLTLVGWIIIYDRWHKGVSWAPIIMGLCRFMLPLIGFFAVGAATVASTENYIVVLTHASSLWILTASITLLARHEVQSAGAVGSAGNLIFFVPLPLLAVLPWNGFICGAAFAYSAWIFVSQRCHPLPGGVGSRVEDRLASFPFIDAMLVGLLYGGGSLGVTAMVQGLFLGCFILV